MCSVEYTFMSFLRSLYTVYFVFDFKISVSRAWVRRTPALRFDERQHHSEGPPHTVGRKQAELNYTVVGQGRWPCRFPRRRLFRRGLACARELAAVSTGRRTSVQ